MLSHKANTAIRSVGMVICVLIAMSLLGACVPIPAPLPQSTLETADASLPPVTVDFSDRVDAQGGLTEGVEVVCSDGRAKMSLAKGAKVLDAQGQPASSITCTPMTPPASQEGVTVGLAYDFGGAAADGTVKPPATLTPSCDAPPASPRIDLTKPQIAGWWTPTSQWVSRPAPVAADEATGTLTSRQANILPVVVIFWYVDLNPPIS